MTSNSSHAPPGERASNTRSLPPLGIGPPSKRPEKYTLRPTLAVRGRTRNVTPARTLSVNVLVATGGMPALLLYMTRSVREDKPAGNSMPNRPSAPDLGPGIAAALAPAYAGGPR